MGVLLKFENGVATAYKPSAPLWMTGDIRDMDILKFKNAGSKVVLSRNNDRVSVYEIAKNIEPTIATIK